MHTRYRILEPDAARVRSALVPKLKSWHALVSFLLWAASAFAESPVVSTTWEKSGFETATPQEADFSVVISYMVPPSVTQGSDIYHFKRFWSKVQTHADGSWDATGGSHGGGIRSCGPSITRYSSVQVGANGFAVFFELSGIGRQSSHLKRAFSIPWSELEKTVKDDKVEIHVTIKYGKPKPDGP